MFEKLCRILFVATCVCVVAPRAAHALDERQHIQQVVETLKNRLAISQTVTVEIVRTNAKLFSVEPAQRHDGTFLLSVEEDFAQALTESELEAAVAHELGHVWIYTHFPFLQTEELANDIASRVIARETLTSLYDKVWKKAAAD